MIAKRVIVLSSLIGLLVGCGQPKESIDKESIAAKERLSNIEKRIEDTAAKLSALEKKFDEQEAKRLSDAKAHEEAHQKAREVDAVAITTPEKAPAISLLKQFNARLEVGILYNDYRRELGDLAAELGRVSEQTSAGKNRREIERIFSLFIKAGEYWQLCLSSDDNRFAYSARKERISADLGNNVLQHNFPTANDVDLYWREADILLESLQ